MWYDGWGGKARATEGSGMRLRKGNILMAALLSFLTFFGFSGCSGRPIGAPECGGTTD